MCRVTVPEIGGGNWKCPSANTSEVIRWNNQLVSTRSGVTIEFDLLGHVTSLVVTCWCPLEPSHYLYNGFRDIQWWMWHMVDLTLNDLYKHNSRLFILEPIDFSYATCYRLLGRYSNFWDAKDAPFSHNNTTLQTSRRRRRTTTPVQYATCARLSWCQLSSPR